MRATADGRDGKESAGPTRTRAPRGPAGDEILPGDPRVPGVTPPTTGAVTTGTVLRLQRSAGNAAVHRLVEAAAPGPAGTPVIQRRISPEDVAGEMVGQAFELRAAFTPTGGSALRAGTRVTVRAWDNAADTVEVTAPPGVARPFRVPKALLVPTRTAVAGVDPYSAGVSGQAAAVTRGEADLAAWLARSAEFTSPDAVRRFQAEKQRLEDLLARRRSVLNRKLIQETMFNRFDGRISAEVAAANRAHGLTGDDALDPNLVKSMLFQESQLGTAGEHLEDPPSHPVKTRFNLGQVIDSSGLALLTLLETEHPAVVAAHSLGRLRRDLADAQNELARLDRKASRTPVEEARRTALRTLSGQSWEVFVWGYRAPGAATGFADAVTAFFAATSPARNVDYGFWIHMAVMWLFAKRRAGMTWPDAIRAYNGGGARARHYRDAVVGRAAGARTAAAAGRDFVPEGS